MAQYAIPTTARLARTVTEREYEDLTHPLAPDGLIGNPAVLPPLVYADGTLLGFKWRPDRSVMVRGLRWYSDDGGSRLVTPNEAAGTKRLDLVVARLGRNPWDITLEVIEGVAAATPVRPSATQTDDTAGGVWELPVAEIEVAYGATNIGELQCREIGWYIGEDGQIICTPSSRPPHYPNRVAYEHTTARLIRSTGSEWRVLSEDTGWVPLTAAAGWAVKRARVRRRDGVVEAQLVMARNGTALAAGMASNLTIDVPVGFRPAEDFISQGVCVSTPDAARISVHPNGVIRLDEAPQLGPTSQVAFHDRWIVEF